jgi:glucan biosynthesis protein
LIRSLSRNPARSAVRGGESVNIAFSSTGRDTQNPSHRHFTSSHSAESGNAGKCSPLQASFRGNESSDEHLFFHQLPATVGYRLEMDVKANCVDLLYDMRKTLFTNLIRRNCAQETE